MNHLGVHWTSELYGCDAELLDDVERIGTLMLEAARVARATVVSSDFHRFAPHGISGVVVIAESHLAIHTWPELGYVALDVFTCGDVLQAEEGFRWLAERFHATRVETLRQERGDPRRIESFRRTPEYRPRHPELLRWDADFAARFIAVGEVEELAEQIYRFPLFTPEFCARLVEECEHRGGWVADPEGTALTWEALPGLEAVYREVVQRHVRPVVERLWPAWKLEKCHGPATRRTEAQGGLDPVAHLGAGAVSLIGCLNDTFTGGGAHFPRWALTAGGSSSARVGSVVVFPGGVSHAHAARPVTGGRCYTLVGAFD